MITITEQIMLDLKEILETVAGINKVSFGKSMPITQEDTFDAIYINPENSAFALRVLGKQLKDYDEFFYITLVVNTDNSDYDLNYLKRRDDIINAVLNDTDIWTNIVDRNVVTVGYDDFENYPKKEMNIVFEFKTREDC